MGLIARLRHLSQTAEQQEAEEVRVRSGCAANGPPLRDRQRAQVRGIIRSVTLPARASVPVLVAELFDGRSTVNLVWIGRRRIPGIEPGVLLSAEGRVAMRGRTPTIFNPSYVLAPPT